MKLNLQYQLFNCFGCILFFTLLIGCDNQNRDMTYLQQHPRELSQLIEQCQMSPPVMREQIQVCNNAFSAGKEIAGIIREIQANPQLFGEKILRAQMQYVSETEKHADTDEKLQSIQTYLAVLGLASPE